MQIGLKRHDSGEPARGFIEFGGFKTGEGRQFLAHGFTRIPSVFTDSRQ
ncbi:hypothetical protein KAS08_04230 [Candidatus Pacearchaeota archaeon]|nr:hypothetical protein [Candidatus Pacearchaeota archaeon]